MPADPRPRVGALAHVHPKARRVPLVAAPRGRLSRRVAALSLALFTGLGAGLCALPARASDYDDALRAGVAARDRARESQFVSDWQSAFEQFQRAVELQDSAVARFELAEAAAALGRVDLAYESHELALAGGVPAKAEAIARAYLDAHAADVARVEVAAPSGTTVSVDGRERGRVPLARPLVVPAGHVTIRLTAPDASIWEETLSLEPRVVRRIALRRAPHVSTTTVPAARASRSQASRATGEGARPAEPEEPSWLGSHPGAVALISVASVSLVAGGWFAYKAYDEKQEADDARNQIMAALQGHLQSNVIEASAVPCGDAGIASGVVGFSPGVPQDAQANLVQQYAAACDEFAKREARSDRLTTVSMIGFGVGLAATAALLTWYIASPSEETPDDEARRPVVVPILSKDTQGVMLELAF